MRSISIRWRLTLFYAVTILLISLVLIVTIFAFRGTIFVQSVESRIRDRAQEATLALGREGGLDSTALDDLGRDGFQILLLDGDGRILAQRNTSFPIGSAAPSAAWRTALSTGGASGRTGSGSAGPSTYVYAIRVDDVSGAVNVIEVMRPFQDFGIEQVTSEMVVVIVAGVILLAVGLAVLGVYLLVRSALSPVQELARTAAEITAGDLGRRMPVSKGRDELARLATSFNELLTRLETSFAERERSLQEQRRFAADASHELRTPLTSILGYAQMIKSWGVADADLTGEGVDAMESEARRMQVLVDQLLRIAHGDEAMVADVSDVPLQRLVAGTVHAAKGVAGDRVDLMMRPFAEEITIRGDAVRLRQMLGVLLDNAIRYTPAGGRVELSVARDRDRATITVADTGHGIAAEHIPHLFERFYRVDQSRTGHGAGLGLAIAKQIVEQHGGTIDVESVVGEGSVFVARLPLSGNASTENDSSFSTSGRDAPRSC